MSSKTKKCNLKRIGWLILHLIIIVNFMVEIFYGFSQILSVLLPLGGKKDPLTGESKKNFPELIAKRRLFATETWVAISGLAIYIAVIYREKFRRPFK